MTGQLIDYEGRRRLLTDAATIAVLGAHPDTRRPAFYVPDYLASKGYRVIPVNVTKVGTQLFDEDVRADLASLKEPIDIVDVFRPSEALAGHLADILAMQPLPKAVWLQLGIHDGAFEDQIRAAGIDIVVNACALADHKAFAIPERRPYHAEAH